MLGLLISLRCLSSMLFFFFCLKQKTAYEMPKCLEFRRVLFRAPNQGTDFQYGLAVQSPVPGLVHDSNRAVHVFLEALGRLRADGDTWGRAANGWELLPGIDRKSVV